MNNYWLFLDRFFQKVRIGLIVGAMAVPLCAEMFTERSVTLSVLQSNRDIALIQSTALRDSLTYIDKMQTWLPSVSLSATHNYVLLDTQTIPPPLGNANSVFSSFGIVAQQNVSSGGVASVSASQNIFHGHSGNGFAKPAYSGVVEISYIQPLLSNAWAYGTSDVQTKLAVWDNALAKVARRSGLLAQIASVRKNYWNYYLSYKTLSINENDVQYSKRAAEFAKEKFKLGAVAELDTLSAMFSLITAEQNLLTAKNSLAYSQRSLAIQLGLSVTSYFAIDTNLVSSLDSMKSFESCSTSAFHNDPELLRLKIATEKYAYLYRDNRNALLPSVSASALYNQKVHGAMGDTLASGNLTIGLKAVYTIPTVSPTHALRKTSMDINDNALNEEYRHKTLANQLRTAYDALRAARKSLELSLIAKHIAQKKLDAVEAGYRLGTKDNLTFENAHNDYLVSANDVLARYVTVKQLEIDLETIIGTVGESIGVKVP